MNVFDNIIGTKHAVCESSLLKATVAGHIYSVKMAADADNGKIIAIGNLVEEQVFGEKAYVAGEKPCLVLTTPLAYNGRKAWSGEEYFYNAEGEIARAYELHVGDIYTISGIAFVGEPAVGKFIDANYTVADVAGESGFVGEIIEEVNYTNSVSYRIMVRSIG